MSLAHDLFLQGLANIEANRISPYFAELTLYHEAMHEENLYRRAQFLAEDFRLDQEILAAPQAFVQFAATTVQLGKRTSASFAFDNEYGDREVKFLPFELASRPVSEQEFLEFICDEGYQRDALWSSEGLDWRKRKNATHPLYWQCKGQWQLRDFREYRLPSAVLPMRYLNAFEAEAYCVWKNSRLPSAAEWHYAAQNGCTSLNCWEWTASEFRPYHGFSAGPYLEYSEPSFHRTRELRGNSPLRHVGLCRYDYRNFFAPHRRDVCAGFRLCRTLD